MGKFWRKMVIDPQSGDPSASRFCLLVLVALIIILAGLDLGGVKFSAWAQLALIVGSVCGVYGANTALRVWRGRVVKDDHKQGER